MNYRPLGQSGIEASVVGLGAWAIGGWMWGEQDDDESIKAIHAALDAGVNLIDTAPMYGYGRSEEVIGKAIADRRDDVVLATKCALRWFPIDQADAPGEPHFLADDKHIVQDKGEAKYKVQKYAAPDSIREELEQSLKRLGTDRIDLYQTHWQDGSTPIEDTMGELLKMKDQGKIRAIGVSNATVEHVQQYEKVGPVDAWQEKYNLIDRDIEETVLPYAHERDIAVLAYSPLASGLLTGKLGPYRVFDEGDLRADRPRFNEDNREQMALVLGQIRKVAAERDITIAQLIIAWVIAQPGVTHALTGMRRPSQAEENAAAGDIELTDEEINAVHAAFRDRGRAIV